MGGLSVMIGWFIIWMGVRFRVAVVAFSGLSLGNFWRSGMGCRVMLFKFIGCRKGWTFRVLLITSGGGIRVWWVSTVGGVCSFSRLGLLGKRVWGFAVTVVVFSVFGGFVSLFAGCRVGS